MIVNTTAICPAMFFFVDLKLSRLRFCLLCCARGIESVNVPYLSALPGALRATRLLPRTKWENQHDSFVVAQLGRRSLGYFRYLRNLNAFAIPTTTYKHPPIQFLSSCKDLPLSTALNLCIFQSPTILHLQFFLHCDLQA